MGFGSGIATGRFGRKLGSESSDPCIARNKALNGFAMGFVTYSNDIALSASVLPTRRMRPGFAVLPVVLAAAAWLPDVALPSG